MWLCGFWIAVMITHIISGVRVCRCVCPRARRAGRHYDVVFLFFVFLENKTLERKGKRMRLKKEKKKQASQISWFDVYSQKKEWAVFRPASVGNELADGSRTKVETKQEDTQSIKWIKFPSFCHLYTTLRSPTH